LGTSNISNGNNVLKLLTLLVVEEIGVKPDSPSFFILPGYVKPFSIATTLKFTSRRSQSRSIG
jgi:hypothetical protein